jgi:hypothetical protein
MIYLYADPGSGILIWQLLLALFFGTTFFFTKIRSWVSAKLKPQPRAEALKVQAKDSPSNPIFRGE